MLTFSLIAALRRRQDQLKGSNEASAPALGPGPRQGNAAPSLLPGWCLSPWDSLCLPAQSPTHNTCVKVTILTFVYTSS